MLALSEGTAGVLGGGEAKETLNVIIQSKPQIKNWETRRQVKAPGKGGLCAGSVTEAMQALPSRRTVAWHGALLAVEGLQQGKQEWW